MPAGDRTGPSGLGPGTGRASGYCFGNDTPGFAGGRGRRIGGGGGRGVRGGLGFSRNRFRFFGYPGNFQFGNDIESERREDDEKILRSRLEALKRSQAEIEKRLDELKK